MVGYPIHSAFCAEWVGHDKTQPPAHGSFPSPVRENTKIAQAGVPADRSSSVGWNAGLAAAGGADLEPADGVEA